MATSWVQLLAAVIAAIVPLHWIITQLAERWAYKHFTVLEHFEQLGTRGNGSVVRKVVICGGRLVHANFASRSRRLIMHSHSIAGLIAARVCADHVEEVVVIDPDNEVLLDRARRDDALLKPRGDEHLTPNRRRPRVMQFNVYHGGQAIFWAGLRRLFPTFDTEMQNAGMK
jgi:hypothetical protein